MQAARLLVRYLGGDLSLVDEIAQLQHVQQALASVPAESLTPGLLMSQRRQLAPQKCWPS